MSAPDAAPVGHHRDALAQLIAESFGAEIVRTVVGTVVGTGVPRQWARLEDEDRRIWCGVADAVLAAGYARGPAPVDYPVTYPDDAETQQCRTIMQDVNDSTLNDPSWRVSVNQVRQILRAARASRKST